MATYGWTGKILRVNLSTGSVTTEPTKYTEEYIGGMGMGMKYLYDEVPMGTKPYDLASKVFIGVGPYTGTLVPCSGRTNFTFFSPFSKGNCVVDGHMGGHTGVQIKYAGFDGIMIEGQSATPKYLKITNEACTLEDATELWGKGVRDTTRLIAQKDGDEFNVCAIGPAGENILNCSAIVNGIGHAAGAGIGAVLGTKKLKAIAIYGTGSVQVADGKKLMELADYQIKDIIGGNNNHNIPTNAQSWSPIVATRKNRWAGAPGVGFGAAEEYVDCEEQAPGTVGVAALRCMKGINDNGAVSQQYLVRQAGCASCPVRCYPQYKMNQLADYDLPTEGSNTCVIWGGTGLYKAFGGEMKDLKDKGDSKTALGLVWSNIMDDLGIWDNYGLLCRDIEFLARTKAADGKKSKLEEVLGDDYNKLPLDLCKEGDPRFAAEVLKLMATKQNKLYHILDGSYYWTQEWNVGDEYWNDPTVLAVNKMGYPKHHANEDGAQSGALYNMIYNRDCMVHTLTNFIRSGTPFETIKKHAEAEFGVGCVDEPKKYTPVNPAKVKMGVWAMFRKNWHDTSTLCDWMWPMTLSISPNREYKGDLDLEAKYFEAVTGQKMTRAEIDVIAHRITCLQRGYTALQMNTKDLRKEHDEPNEWLYDDAKAFTEGSEKMSHADFDKARDMFYEELGWDAKTGIPTRKTLESLNLKYLADDLAKAGLLPA